MDDKPVDWPSDMKKTRQRLAVYQALSEAETPLTAMELASRLEKQGETLWLSTIYRVLELFGEKGMVLKTQVVESGTAIYELSGEHHRHYAVCVLCNRVIPMENCPMDQFFPRLSDRDFHILGHRLQIYGYCGDCVGQQKKKPGSHQR